jgi:hypothetical protein
VVLSTMAATLAQEYRNDLDKLFERLLKDRDKLFARLGTASDRRIPERLTPSSLQWRLMLEDWYLSACPGALRPAEEADTRLPPSQRSVPLPALDDLGELVISFDADGEVMPEDLGPSGELAAANPALVLNIPIRAAYLPLRRIVARPEDGTFGVRREAEALTRVDHLKKATNARGKDVNVVVVDTGLDKREVKRLGGRFGGGWARTNFDRGYQPGESREPGMTQGPAAAHGNMIVRNVLRTAPAATIFDLPLLPERILDIPTYLGDAQAAFARMLADIRRMKGLRDSELGRRWVIVNAWAVFDRRSGVLEPATRYSKLASVIAEQVSAAQAPMARYGDDPGHCFHDLLDKMADEMDLVFCAGNCGEFAPDSRCGPGDRGPRRSIHGANSHPRVLTIGAVRTDGIWLGYSSQGPGQEALVTKRAAAKFQDPNDPAKARRRAREKPDLCAPSHFCEDDDAHSVNTGTSAACAFTAGVIAALRSARHPEAQQPTSEELMEILRGTASRPPGPLWDERLGYGVLNAKAAYEEFQAWRDRG